MFDLLALVLFTALGTGFAWKGSELLVAASDALGERYGVPPVVQGAVIAAAGSSFPEFASTVIAVSQYGTFELGLGAVLGSGVYNILVIPAVATLSRGGALSANRDLVYKEAQFYLISLATLLLVLSLGVIYFPVSSTTTALDGRLTPLLALLLVGLYGLYIFIQYADAVEYVPEIPTTDVGGRPWLTLLASLALVVVGAELLVRAAVGFGAFFDTPDVLWGLTVVAAGTSLPDTFVSVVAARSGGDSLSLANVLGSNVFALLIALPAGVLAAGGVPIDFAAVVPLLGFLVAASVVFFAALRTDLSLARWEAYLLLGMYGLFIAWLVAEAVGVTRLLAG
ncbi:sodium:calcium antiporter [Halobium salinum]|uniref:Sodium:calcium antiporter n=1 Tax=Halobium salinum TaxID=1364940 RepID=A0ABD5P8N2_9EURY|nr:sodium:calcium antiporter [Halobium salinum]